MEETKRTLNLILGLSSEKGRKSTLQMALEQARHLIGYDKEKGITRAGYNCRRLNIRNENGHVTADLIDDSRQEDMIDNCDAFTALTLYLISLDQLGCIFTSGSRDLKIWDLLKCLEIPQLKGEDYQTTDKILRSIDSLRNSLCHNFGLAAKNASDCHKFILDFNDSDCAIKLPVKHWNGNWNDKTEEMQTTVFVFPFCNAIEAAIASVLEKHKSDEFQCSMDVEELKTRFTIMF
jgi:hypothetical protein